MVNLVTVWTLLLDLPNPGTMGMWTASGVKVSIWWIPPKTSLPDMFANKWRPLGLTRPTLTRTALTQGMRWRQALALV